MQPVMLFAILSVLATGSVHAIPHHHHMPRSTPTARPALAEVGLDLSPALMRLERQLDDGQWSEDTESAEADDGMWHGDDPVSAMPEPAELPAPSEAPSAWSESASSSPTSVWSEIPGPTSTDAAAGAMQAGSSATPTPTSASYSYTSFTPAMTSTTSWSALGTTTTSTSASAAPTASAGVKAAADDEGQDQGDDQDGSEGAGGGEVEHKDRKAKKIRYKQCPSTGTVSEIKVTPCEGGKGTIIDPCHFHAGS